MYMVAVLDSFGTSDVFDDDGGGVVRARIVVRSSDQPSQPIKSNAGTACNSRRDSTRVIGRAIKKRATHTRSYIYISTTLYKLCGSCPQCEGLAVGHARKRGVLRRGTIHCPCGWFGYGRDLEEQQWFTTTLQ